MGDFVGRIAFATLAVLRRESRAYWATAAALLVAITLASPIFEQSDDLRHAKYWLFQTLSRSMTNPSHARSVKLVMIRDDEFWTGDLHHRNPTDRTYLAKLIYALDVADASVIALDFDLRLANPSAVVRPGDYLAVDSVKSYRDETDALIHAIDEVANKRKIVLAKTIVGTPDSGYAFEPDAYQAYGLCVASAPDGTWVNPGTGSFPLLQDAKQNISCGYIALMGDSRRIPPPVPIAGQKYPIDSFPLAVARARAPQLAPNLTARRYFGTYVGYDVENDRHVTVSAHDLFADPKRAKSVLQGYPVVVGAGWHLRGIGRGPETDLHETPIGDVSGAVIHEDRAEAVLGERSFPGISDFMLKLLEVVVGIAAAVFFASFSDAKWRLAALVGTMIALAGAQWVTLQLFGTFFDAFIPVLGLGVHAVIGSLLGQK